MKALICSSCGASRWKEESEYRVCLHCGTKFEKVFVEQRKEVVSNIQTSVARQAQSVIALNNDVARLLQKCHEEPQNAKRYANLILDIDPTNKQALKYLNGGK